MRHPEVFDRLRREIESVAEFGVDPNREHIRKMPFLSCVVKESKFRNGVTDKRSE